MADTRDIGTGAPQSGAPTVSGRTGARLSSAARWLLAACVAVTAAQLSGCAASAQRFTAEEVDAAVETNDRDASSRAADVHSDARGIYKNLIPPGVNRDKVLLEVVGFLGVPYRTGGMAREGMDCSGFVLRVYAGGFGIMLPRSTREQFEVGEVVDKDGLQFGDLVFFNTTGARPSHVGVYLEDDLFAHASVSAGVTISSLESAYYRKRFVGARRPAVRPAVSE